MKLVTLFLALTYLPVAMATGKPCVNQWDTIEINLSHNHGCKNRDFPEHTKHCTEFYKCIRNYDICVISGGKVFGGNSVSDFRLKPKRIWFGINQTLSVNNERYCVLGAMSQGPGEENPSWDFGTLSVETNDWQNDAMIQTPLKLTEFLKKTVSAFNRFQNAYISK